MDQARIEALRRHFARVKAGNRIRDARPLDVWHFAVPRLREAFAMFTGPDWIDELHAIGANKGTKTQTMAAYVVACCQKRTHLDGVKLPYWRGRVEAAQLVLDYPQQLLSVQPAYLKVLGAWPHHARYVGETLKSLHIMPIGGDPNDETKWSVVHFMSEEGRKKRGTRGLGVRADIVAFDEPPHIDTLRELRKAAHAGRRLILILAYTPTVRSQWAPVIADIGKDVGGPGFRQTLKRIDRDRAVVRWSLEEVSDRVLSRAEKDGLLRKYLGPAMDLDHPLDPLAKARIHGDAIDTSGLCPFHLPTLDEMLAACVEPETVSWKITQEADAVSGRTRISRAVPVEVFWHARVDRTYWVTIDPSSGVDDSMHDPYELEVTEDGTGDLVLRAGGYLPGYLVGILAAGIARQYNNAQIDVEVNDRWGTNVVEGIQASRYGNFARERRELRPGEWATEIGFHNTGKSRPAIIGAVQAWIEAWRSGIRYGKCPSRKVIETLIDCILDENGKIVGAPGVHDECLIVRGQALRRAVRRHGMEIPEGQRPARTDAERVVAMLRGEIPRRGVSSPRGGLLRSERPRV